MLIDTHCHLDLIKSDSGTVMQAAMAENVQAVIVPGVDRQNFSKVIELNAAFPTAFYALGIHPLSVADAKPSDLDDLAAFVEASQPIAIGEIGLDYYLQRDNVEQQQTFFKRQLQLAQQFDLPVILHVRGAIAAVLKCLRDHPVVGGIAHAFNGSFQQAEQFIKLGFKLGFGGAMTYDRAQKIRRLATELPLSSIVLETDSPDMAPAWLEKSQQNTPVQLYKIATVLAELRQMSLNTVIAQTTANAVSLFPRLASSVPVRA